MKLTPIQELEAAIRERPANADLYLQIVPLYLECGRDYEAEKLLAKGAGETNDPRVIEQWEELTLTRYERSVKVAGEWCEGSDSAESRAALTAARAAQERGRMAIYTARCQREPADAQAHYELGRCLRAEQKLVAACAEFERSLANEALRPVAAMAVGECQRELGLTAEALKYFRVTAATARAPEQQELKDQALEQAVELAKRLKLPQLAARYASQRAAEYSG